MGDDVSSGDRAGRKLQFDSTTGTIREVGPGRDPDNSVSLTKKDLGHASTN